jgi:hypothetical protein
LRLIQVNFSHRGSAAPIEDVGTILARLRGLIARGTQDRGS